MNTDESATRRKLSKDDLIDELFKNKNFFARLRENLVYDLTPIKCQS